jgi:uncharacterized protein
MVKQLVKEDGLPGQARQRRARVKWRAFAEVSMPTEISFPGVFIEEIPSGVHTIEGVSTSVAAFIGRSLRGPVQSPGLLGSFADFVRLYGGLWTESTLGYAVAQFYDNGGSQAVVVRVHNGATAARAVVSEGGLGLIAANEGQWGNALRARVDVPTPGSRLFDLAVKDLEAGSTEAFEKLSVDQTHPRFVGTILAQESRLIRLDGAAAANPPPPNAAPASGGDAFADSIATHFADGSDGDDITDAQISDSLPMLDEVHSFNLLLIPPLKRSGGDVGKASWDAAIAYAKARRAFVIVDPPERWATAADVLDPRTGISSVVTAADNAAIYFPRLIASDPLNDGQLASFAPGGAIAGIFARTDRNAGVWKAPTGLHAVVRGAVGLSLGGSTASGKLSNADETLLNSAGINCLRNSLPTAGTVVWGARTLVGADALASDWKYIPVRRLAFYIEQSVLGGTQWTAFEPDGPALWSHVTQSVGAFLQTLFRQGAFQGDRPQRSYFVKCDQETMTQDDIDKGRLIVLIGMATVKPAEFVIMRIQLKSGKKP